ncbi:nuclear transport factor 2 family protein [Acinetobacter sp.]|jgi:hypothetical protein|uniref:nuclear transport factor 2 family protein n=1 Tax=Acinetobacter sp. TaxID=472 RepID=UPI00282DFBA3|nr:nuclear transport factor 2 family protein [Acinetobacter sp.]MDR0235768.1 nuclear transport factor 2 family protein [Acinetobacter sp.]
MASDELVLYFENKLLEAMKNADIDVLDELLHDNLIFNIPTGQTITKAEDIESYRLGVMTIHEISATEYVIKTIENISTVAVTVYLKAKYAEHAIDGQFRYLRVWKRTDHSWKVISGSAFKV